MALPYFYVGNYSEGQSEVQLDENNSRHVIQVLRMLEGEQLNLTDGKGNLLTGEISKAHKKHCIVNIQHSTQSIQHSRKIKIGISLLKNTSRFEWFLEKATEIGITEVIPLICERTEKQKFRYDRMKDICISAMLQSQQSWLPILEEPVNFKDFVSNKNYDTTKFIAHCEDSKKKELSVAKFSNESLLIAIGPEGDFSTNEIESAIQNDFIPISLGKTRLRTETAGIVAVTLLANIQ